LCEVCHDTVEANRLISNPLERFCLDHLNAKERRALEDDLNLASQVQLGLLPDLSSTFRIGFDQGFHKDSRLFAV